MSRASYSTYDAKARFSEILRKVRSGESVCITYRGVEVAEIRPIQKTESAEEILERLERVGILSAEPGHGRRPMDLEPLARRPGALKRFLESRD